MSGEGQNAFDEVQQDAVEPQVPEESAPERNLVSRLGELGYEVDEGYDDQAFVKDLGEIQERLEGYEKQRPLLEQFQQHAADFQEWLESRKGESGRSEAESETEPEAESDSGSEADAEPEPLWNPPEVDPLAAQLVQGGAITRNEKTGLYESDRPALQSFAEQLNRREAYRQRFFAGFDANPVDFLGKLTEPQLKKYVGGLESKYRTEIEDLKKQVTALSQGRFQDERAGFFQQHAHEFFQFDEQGQPVTEDGHYKLSPRGRAYASAEKLLREAGLNDERKIHELALQAAEQAGPSEPEAQAPTRQEKKRGFRRKTLSASGQNGSTNRIVNRSVPDTSNVVNRKGVDVVDWDALIREAEASQ